MVAFCWNLRITTFFDCRIYRLFLAVAGLIMSLGVAYSQEMGAYKTLSSGDFPNISIWATWNGTSWVPAAAKPGLLNDIYIDQNHTLRLTGNEQAKSVFINAEAEAGQKLNLNGFNLDIYGTLSAFSGPAPGVPANAWNSQNWIGNSLSSTITFRGNSRKILDKSSWSAQTTQSRFGVIFDPGFGVELTVEAPLKALSFTVKSGTLIQKLDTSVIPNVCFTLSFNTETTVFGSGPFGDFTIEDGATFISECNSNIVNRSTNGSVSALNFDLQNGGTLILEGSAPRIEAANFQLNGRIIFRGPSGPKSFLSSSFSDAASPQSVRHLELESSQNLSLPNQLFLLGNMTKSGTGNFLTSNTHLILNGSTNQEIIGFSLTVRDLTLNKSNNIFFPRGNLTVERTLTLTQGRIDLQQNDLRINTSGQGGINYGGGSWRNAGSVTYFNIPSLLTATNATFPFEDMQNGGIRKIQLLGPSPGGNLSLRFLEYKGANHDPKFNDTDGTPILYQLYSHFQFSGLSPSNQEVELKISAASLIVDNVDDLRVVGTGQPSPGNHLPGLDPSLLWARRSLQWDELSNFNFTIGSFRELSILPVSWISINVSQSASGKMITWKVGQERNNLLFEIYRSHVEKLEWEKIGSIASKGNSKNPVEYSFEDKSTKRFKEYLYRIRQISLDGSESWSVVARTFQDAEGPTHNLLVYPNPHERGPLRIWASKNWDFSDAKLMILSLHGQVLLELPYASEIQEQFVNALAPGNYFLHLVTPYQSFSTRFIKH